VVAYRAGSSRGGRNASAAQNRSRNGAVARSPTQHILPHDQQHHSVITGTAAITSQ
jgi:hypothetical protein